jgi:hypothetical protein
MLAASSTARRCRSQPDDFRVLTALLEGAPARLRPGGSLWIVAQAQVPVGRLAAGVRVDSGDGGDSEGRRAYASVTAQPVDRGRFVVWHAVAA